MCESLFVRGVCLETDMAILGKGGVCVCVCVCVCEVGGGRRGGGKLTRNYTRSPKQMCVHLWGRR